MVEMESGLVERGERLGKANWRKREEGRGKGRGLRL